MEKKVSFIIVNYNTGGLLRNCLESIKINVHLSFEVVVVDNHSSDDSLSLCKKLFDDDKRFVLFVLNDNLGFAKGCNYGAERASGNFYYFLNPDTELTENMDQDIMYVTEHPDKVYVSPLLNIDGSVENPKRVIPTLKNIFFWNFCRKKAGIWYKGASVFVLKELFIFLKKWPEDYFMYSEDLDFFFIVWVKGIDVIKLNTPILHFGGSSSSKRWSPLEREIEVQRSFRVFYAKYFPKRKYVSVMLYFLFHDLLKHPKRGLLILKSWFFVSKMPYFLPTSSFSLDK